MKKLVTASSRTVANSYKALVKRIIQEFAELEAFVKNRVAKGHWNVGKYIDEHLLAHKDRAEYGTGFLRRTGRRCRPRENNAYARGTILPGLPNFRRKARIELEPLQGPDHH